MITWIFTILLVLIISGTEGESKPHFYQRHLRYTTSSLPYEQERNVRQNPQLLDGPTLANLFQRNYNFFNNLNQVKPQTFNDDTARYRRVEESDRLYGDYKRSQSVNHVGPGHIETIESEHYHRKVPAFDTFDFNHGNERTSEDSHAEVHYHQHKHIHKHDHKQEHAHMHKNEHQHNHTHQQQHKHDHYSDHKHGHDHKHDHHQNHKHGHHHKHKHGHEQKHKHDHHHGHKHQHQTHSHHGHSHKYEHGHHGHN
ncbi:hypothetical protein RI129_009738 [Pyrocoelia pectoralis]|uniref:Histidine-rich glycoprotein-like n=1 Tax=Pyrocoelia pectoralis TaxID=417401 RepID=A0AAN7V9W5_9COLE